MARIITGIFPYKSNPKFATKIISKIVGGGMTYFENNFNTGEYHFYGLINSYVYRN